MIKNLINYIRIKEPLFLEKVYYFTTSILKKEASTKTNFRLSTTNSTFIFLLYFLTKHKTATSLVIHFSAASHQKMKKTWNLKLKTSVQYLVHFNVLISLPTHSSILTYIFPLTNIQVINCSHEMKWRNHQMHIF